MSESPAAGWYADPNGAEAQQRYWDGATWTEQTRPVESVPETSDRRELRQARRQQKAEASAEKKFDKSPAGQARLAFDRGDMLFQMSMNLERQFAFVTPMLGSAVGRTSKAKDWSAELNRVVGEGWELVSSSVVYVQTQQESRDRLLASGQNIGTGGDVVGYYVFRRHEANRQT